MNESESYLQGFKEHLASQNKSSGSIEYYHKALRLFLNYAEKESLAVRKMQKSDLIQFMANQERHRQKNGKPLSSGTRQNRVIVIMSFFQYLLEKGEIILNPALNLPVPKRRRSIPWQTLSPHEVLAMLDAVDLKNPCGLRDHTIIEVLYATGIRKAELIDLRISDIDFAKKLILIRASKNFTQRLIPISPRALMWLEKYMQNREDFLSTETDIVFLTRTGGPLNSIVLAAYMRRLKKKAGINKPGSVHLFRHSMATHMLKQGADIRYIQEMLGHKSLESTQIYTHVHISDLKEVHRKTHPAEKRYSGRENNFSS